jgi:uncharacterized membrane protein YphA (DoxX/SURF4 family)
MKNKNILSWVLRIAGAAIMLQTLYFKFTAQPESVYIFSTVGIEPWGRIGTGVAELIASALLLIPSTIAIGAGMGVGLMAGAILTHATIIGFNVQNDGGKLFSLALAVFICCSLVLILHAQQLRELKNKLLPKK